MSRFIKRFFDWVFLKIHLDRLDHKPPLFNEREVWWCYMGENIGAEISGKGKDFFRPVLILKKLDKYSFIGLPLTKKKREGSRYYSIILNNNSNTVILSQVHYMDYRRLHKLFSTIPDREILEIKARFIKFFQQ